MSPPKIDQQTEGTHSFDCLASSALSRCTSMKKSPNVVLWWVKSKKPFYVMQCMSQVSPVFHTVVTVFNSKRCQYFWGGTRVDKRRIPDQSTGPCLNNNGEQK